MHTTIPCFQNVKKAIKLAYRKIDGETVEAVSDFIFLGSKITADVTAAMKLKDTYSLEGKL